GNGLPKFPPQRAGRRGKLIRQEVSHALVPDFAERMHSRQWHLVKDLDHRHQRFCFWRRSRLINNWLERSRQSRQRRSSNCTTKGSQVMNDQYGALGTGSNLRCYRKSDYDGNDAEVIYVPDELGDGVFVVTRYALAGKQLKAFRRRRRSRGR